MTPLRRSTPNVHSNFNLLCDAQHTMPLHPHYSVLSFATHRAGTQPMWASPSHMVTLT